MKKLLKILILFAILLALGYIFRSELGPRVVPAWNAIKTQFLDRYAPCTAPIRYTLGTFDTQFGISREYFLSAIEEAEAIWEKPQGKPFGKELFAYEDNAREYGALKINLVYDYRQQATSKLAELGITVKDTRASYDSLKVKFEELKTKLEKAESEYRISAESFNQRQDAYEQEVKYWNDRGGAPKKEYGELQAEKSALDVELTKLKTKQGQINEMIDEINAFVVVLNRLANTLNISVDQYNTVNVSRGESFTEGVYFSDGFKREINIYEFSSRDKLVRVLAHELGHALNLEHVEDPKAIMYELNQGENMTLTDADLEALKAKCGVE